MSTSSTPQQRPESPLDLTFRHYEPGDKAGFPERMICLLRNHVQKPLQAMDIPGNKHIHGQPLTYNLHKETIQRDDPLLSGLGDVPHLDAVELSIHRDVLDHDEFEKRIFKVYARATPIDLHKKILDGYRPEEIKWEKVPEKGLPSILYLRELQHVLILLQHSAKVSFDSYGKERSEEQRQRVYKELGDVSRYLG